MLPRFISSRHAIAFILIVLALAATISATWRRHAPPPAESRPSSVPSPQIDPPAVEAPPVEPPPSEPVMVPPPTTTIQIGRSVQGEPIEARILGEGSETVMVLASIHGSEPAGTPLVAAMLDHIMAHPQMIIDRRVIVVPIANPDGYARRHRHNDRGVDLNRNFPAANRKNNERFGAHALSEPEARAIHDLIADYKPDRIVSLHQPVSCIDYDGPAKQIAAAMASVCDLPIRRLGGRPGSLGSYAGTDLGIPIITLELRKGEESLGPELLWAKYGRAMLAFLEFRSTDLPEGG